MDLPSHVVAPREPWRVIGGPPSGARAEGRRAALLYALSTVPALWAVFAGFSALALALGFALLLALDARAQAWGLAPPWWMRLRVLLTTLVVLFLLAGVP